MSCRGFVWIAGRVFFALCCAAVIFGVHHMRVAYAQSAGDTTKLQLEAQLQSLTAQDTTLNAQITSLEEQKSSLNRDVSLLNAQIAQTKVAIQKRDLTMQQLSGNIQDEEDNISGLDSKLQSEYESLAAILREANQIEGTSAVITALSAENLSAFFADLDQFTEINQNMQASFADIQTNRQLDEQQKTNLQNQLDEETQLRQVQQLQQQQLQAQEDQKNQLIAETNGQEGNYQSILAKNQKTAAQIRAALFSLTGSKAIPFEDAVQYADVAQKQTGIRPAFLLGIIAEESDLGANVGTGNWQTDMYQCYVDLGSPTTAGKQKSAFLSITSSLGLDPNALPVSKKPWYGCGGAMGPAQFIPTTWALYAGYVAPTYAYDPSKDRIGNLTESRPPSPWNPQDAFMAAAIYLTDDGAAKQTKSAEFTAAMCYLAGCGKAGDANLSFYGNDVAKLATQYQCQIDILNGNNNTSSCASAGV